MEWLKTLKQYAFLTVAGVIGILILILRSKNSRIKELQIKLLRQVFEAAEKQVEEKIEKARQKTGSAKEKYEKALAEYRSQSNSDPS